MLIIIAVGILIPAHLVTARVDTLQPNDFLSFSINCQDHRIKVTYLAVMECVNNTRMGVWWINLGWRQFSPIFLVVMNVGGMAWIFARVCLGVCCLKRNYETIESNKFL